MDGKRLQMQTQFLPDPPDIFTPVEIFGGPWCKSNTGDSTSTEQASKTVDSESPYCSSVGRSDRLEICRTLVQIQPHGPWAGSRVLLPAFFLKGVNSE